MKVAVCPGSFDPVTVGHLDIIRRAARIFDHVVVAVGSNMRKAPRLSAVERARLIEKVTADIENVSVEVMEGLLVEFAREQGARAIVKGLRAVSDFESEFEQAQLNRTHVPGDRDRLYNGGGGAQFPLVERGAGDRLATAATCAGWSPTAYWRPCGRFIRLGR